MFIDFSDFGRIVLLLIILLLLYIFLLKLLYLKIEKRMEIYFSFGYIYLLFFVVCIIRYYNVWGINNV